MSESVGDGTTTTAILTGLLLQECNKYLVAGVDPRQLAQGMKDAALEAINILYEMSMPVDEESEVRSVALISANGDEELADLLTQAVMAVGKKGTILIEDGKGTHTEVLLRDGMPLDTGFLQRNQHSEEVFEQPMLALFDCGLYSFEDIREVIEVASQWPHPLIIIAHAVENGALATWTINSTGSDKPTWVGTLVKAPGWGHHRREILDDIASLSGATVIDQNAGMSLQTINPEWLGSVQTATVRADSTTLVGYADADTTERVQSRIRSLQTMLERTTHEYDADQIQERMAKLAGGLAILRVGGVTEPAMRERRARLEDSLNSVRAALESGIVPGAGAAYLFAAQWLSAQDPPEKEGEQFGYSAFIKALQEPFSVLTRNAGQNTGSALLAMESKQEKENFSPWVGWDILGSRARLLYENPMIADATKVAVEAIRYAVSSASTVITTEAMVVRNDS